MKILKTMLFIALLANVSCRKDDDAKEMGNTPSETMKTNGLVPVKIMDYNKNGELSLEHNFTYADLDQLTKYNIGQSQFSLLQQGEQVKEVSKINKEDGKVLASYFYYPNGKIKTENFTDGKDKESINYTYDTQDRLTKAVYQYVTSEVTYSYSYPNSSTIVVDIDNSRKTPNMNIPLPKITLSLADGQVVKSVEENAYRNSRPKTESGTTVEIGTETIIYTYDDKETPFTKVRNSAKFAFSPALRYNHQDYVRTFNGAFAWLNYAPVEPKLNHAGITNKHNILTEDVVFQPKNDYINQPPPTPLKLTYENSYEYNNKNMVIKATRKCNGVVETSSEYIY